MLTNLKSLMALKADRRGIAAIEYALIAAFMSVVLIAALPGVTGAITTAFSNIATHVSTGK